MRTVSGATGSRLITGGTGGHAVVNDHGLGTGPGPRSAARTVNVYLVQGANNDPWRIVTTVSLLDHAYVKGSDGGETVKRREEVGLTGLLNQTVIGASKGTSVSPSAGDVRTMYRGQGVAKANGFGIGPGSASFPSMSWAGPTLTAYWVQGEKPGDGYRSSSVL